MCLGTCLPRLETDLGCPVCVYNLDYSHRGICGDVGQVQTVKKKNRSIEKRPTMKITQGQI